MDISSINNNLNSNTMNNAKNKVVDDDFQKQLKSAMDSKDDKQLKKVCNDFEGILLNMMYKEMKATVPKSDLLEEDPGKDIFDSMLDDKLMNEASSSGGIGLADVMYKQLSKQLKAKDEPAVKAADKATDIPK
jgi:peptidoglycan hydrolase FlgJ